MDKITERSSEYRHLEKMTTSQLLRNMNQEDAKVPVAVASALDGIERLVDQIYNRMSSGGRLFYIGAGTSGRLGVLDASECPPTYGVPEDMVIGLIAGGDVALRKSIEHAEDDVHRAMTDLDNYGIDERDVVVGIASSGTTPYVVHGLKDCRGRGILTGCITCNPGTPILDHSDYPILVVVGPEFVTGSTRMKSGTAQKLVLNMISTSVMIKLGRVEDNKMVDMALSNEKLKNRGTEILMQRCSLDRDSARTMLIKAGSVRKALKILEQKD